MNPDARRDDLEALLSDERTPQGWTWLQVLDAACAVAQVKRDDAIEIVVHPVAGVGFVRLADLSLARKLCWAALRELGGMVTGAGGVPRKRYSFPFIGRVWCELDHTTVMSGIRSVRGEQVAAVLARLPPVARPGVARTTPASSPSVPEQLLLRGVG